MAGFFWETFHELVGMQQGYRKLDILLPHEYDSGCVHSGLMLRTNGISGMEPRKTGQELSSE